MLSTSKRLLFALSSIVASTVLGGAMVAAPASAQTPTVYAYLSAPNSQSAPASVPGKTVETFDENGMTTGNHTNFSSAIGTYTGTFDVIPSDQYGAGTGNYISIGSQSGTTTPLTLTFATPVTYFGLSYNAGDTNNGLTFYDANGNDLGRYSTATLIAKLNGGTGTVTALDGTTYQSANYYGRPDGNTPNKTASNQDTAEPFAFIDFFPSVGTTIKTVVFDNSGTMATGFETDNHTISTSGTNAPPTTGSFVAVGDTAAPEPGSIALLALSGLPVVGTIARRRRKA